MKNSVQAYNHDAKFIFAYFGYVRAYYNGDVVLKYSADQWYGSIVAGVRFVPIEMVILEYALG